MLLTDRLASVECRETSRGNPNYFLTYGNGKAAARIVRDFLSETKTIVVLLLR